MVKIKTSDAAFCAGIADHVIRDWRRKGFLPSRGGAHQFWTVDEVFRLWVLARFSEIGVCLRLASSHVAELKFAGSSGRVAAFRLTGGDLRFAVMGWADLDPTDGVASVAVNLSEFPSDKLPDH